jgi:O-acetylserine/cysteine efflux transporter
MVRMSGKDIGIALWVVLLWSSNLVVQKFAVDHLSIFVLSFLRVGLVFPLLFFYPKPYKSLWKYFLIGFFLIALYLTLFGLGLKSDIGAGLSAFFLQAQVLFVILCCFLMLGEKPTWFQVVGLFISFGGVYLLTATSDPSDVPFFGVVFLLAACASFGIGVAFSKKYKIGESMSDITWLSMTATIPLLFSCFLFEGPLQTFENVVHLSPTALFCVVFATLLSTIWATYLWLNLLQKFPASSVAPFMLLFPLFSNILSHIIMGENLTMIQMVSGFVITLGVMFAQGLHKRIPKLIYWVKNRVES